MLQFNIGSPEVIKFWMRTQPTLIATWQNHTTSLWYLIRTETNSELITFLEF